MKDIKGKKPKIINLRNKKVKVQILDRETLENFIKADGFDASSAVLEKAPKEFEEIIGTFQCVQCKTTVVSKEFGRCDVCEVEHQKLIQRLDSTSHKSTGKESFRNSPNWVSFKQNKGGVIVTTYLTVEEAQARGMKIT